MTKKELEKEADEFTDSKKSFWRQGRTCIDSVKQAYIIGAEPREKRIAELELKIKHLTEHLEPQSMTALFEQVEEEVKQEQRLNELEKENAELKAENQKWKDEWQEQVQKANDEGYARTLQTIQLTKANEIIKNLLTLSIPIDYAKCPGPLQKIAEAEQFLKEVEE